MAYDPVADADLELLEAKHLFKPSTTHIGCRKGTFLRRYMYDFIELFAPHLTRERVEAAFGVANKNERDALFRPLELPQR